MVTNTRRQETLTTNGESAHSMLEKFHRMTPEHGSTIQAPAGETHGQRLPNADLNSGDLLEIE